jgi:hypothetical protein
VDFISFVLSQLPSGPVRVLEIGCGTDGGITPGLVEAGHDAVGVDPRAPEGPRFRRIQLEDLDEDGFDAVVGERVLHHVDPLGPALDKLARLAPLLLLDEFAWEQMDEATRDWYESQHRALAAAGIEPHGPPDWASWDEEHVDLHRSGTLRRELNERYDERLFEWRPYLYRWLRGPMTQALEESLITAGAIKPLGFRWVGVSR